MIESEHEDIADVVSMALTKAYILGQTYFSQADSESWRMNKKANDTEAEFQNLVDDVRDKILSKTNL